VPARLETFRAVVAEEERAVEELGMRGEALGLRGELEPGARHRLVILARDACANGDAANAVGESAERFFVRIASGELPRDAKVPFVRELGGGNAPRLESS
jgi:hypothetical protein